MKINSIKLQNWRNQKKFNFEFTDINIFIGKNASGKTNILEAVYYLATGKSFRTKDEYLINWESDFLRLVGEIEKEKVEELVVVIEKSPKLKKTVKIKGQKKPSSHLLGNLNCVLFTPEEIDLISNLPEARRRYLNMIISQISRDYVYNLIHFKRTLEQRNSLLKRIFEQKSKPNELEIWDGKLAEYGSEIIKARQDFIGNINKDLSENYQMLSGVKETLQLEYKPSVKDDWAGMIAKLVTNREKDIRARVTTVGPHRDDFSFKLNNKDLNEFASRGEFRTAVLALKLSEIRFFTEKSATSPVLLLDDVFSELDVSRRDLLSQIFKNQQTIVTTTDLDHVSKNIISDAKTVEL